jgi:hypothetical protein
MKKTGRTRTSPLSTRQQLRLLSGSQWSKTQLRSRREVMQRVRIKGIAAYQSTPEEYMRDMLRYDDGKIEAIWDYPDSQLTYHLPFTAIVQLKGYTPDRWRSFGLVTDVLGDVGEYSPQGYTVDEWIADRSPVQD